MMECCLLAIFSFILRNKYKKLSIFAIRNSELLLRNLKTLLIISFNTIIKKS
jgi:hypothetical protein